VSRATYLDSSAIVKLAVAEAESSALRRYLRRRKPYVSSAHLATAQQLGNDLARLVTYDTRMQAAAEHLGLDVAAPA
jgi:predicted nucleic acid-binding protein